jgi:hypothetical protein
MRTRIRKTERSSTTMKTSRPGGGDDAVTSDGLLLLLLPRWAATCRLDPSEAERRQRLAS